MVTLAPDDVAHAVVHIISRGNNTDHRRVLWRVTVADAKRICEDPRTLGKSYMLVWSSSQLDDPDLNRYVPDSGKHAHVLAELRVTVLRSHDTNGKVSP